MPELTWKTALLIAVTPLVIRFWRLRQKKSMTNGIRSLAGPSDGTWLEGHFTLLFSKDSWQYHRDLAEKYGRTSRIRGPFGEDMVYTYDPKAMHHILLKDQTLYEETLFFIANNWIMFGPGLLSVTGDVHRKQRKMLNPVFSVAHLRNMVPAFFDVSEELCSTFIQKLAKGEEEVEVVTWLTRAALEIVGRSGFGTSFGPISDEQKEHEYITSAKEIQPLMTATLFPRVFLLPLAYKYRFGGAWLRRFILDLVPSKPIQQLKGVVDMMHRTSVELFEAKLKAMSQVDSDEAQELSEGKDIIGVLMRENAKAADEDRFTDEEVIAQMSTLMFAAMDTTSSALARILHLLSINQDAQDKLRAELLEAQESFGDRPDHDQLVSLPYLDAVCRETMRLYPPVATLIREAQADVILPLSTPMKTVDGSDASEIFLEKNTKLFLSVQSCNTDPAIWGSNSHDWVPERWMEALPQSVGDAKVPGVYSHLMTFNGGGRSCIGFKFAQLEMKIILFSLLTKFRFSLPKDAIYWQMTIVTSPTTDPKLSSPRPSMPLAISRA